MSISLACANGFSVSGTRSRGSHESFSMAYARLLFTAGSGDAPMGRDGLRSSYRVFHGAFPDIQVVVDDVTFFSHQI